MLINLIVICPKKNFTYYFLPSSTRVQLHPHFSFNMSTDVLVKIYHHDKEILLDHRILSKDDADKLSRFFADNPDFVVSLSGPYDWEESLHDLRLEIIQDSTLINAFRLLYPNGIKTRPIYEDIWRTLRDEQEEDQQ